MCQQVKIYLALGSFLTLLWTDQNPCSQMCFHRGRDGLGEKHCLCVLPFANLLNGDCNVSLSQGVGNADACRTGN